MLESSSELAANELERISTIYADFARENEAKFRALHEDLNLLNLQNPQGLIVCKDEVRKTPIYDILSLISITKNVFGDESKNE